MLFLNHERRRWLRSKKACEVYHDPALRLALNRRSRDDLLRWLKTTFQDNLQPMAAADQPTLATVWRWTVEAWLRCQGLIRIRPQLENQ